jgi:hypothetical protein
MWSLNAPASFATIIGNVACGKMSTFLLLMRHGLQAGEGFPAKPMAFPAQLVQVADTSPRLGQ